MKMWNWAWLCVSEWSTRIHRLLILWEDFPLFSSFFHHLIRQLISPPLPPPFVLLSLSFSLFSVFLHLPPSGRHLTALSLLMSAWAKAPARGLGPIKPEEKEHFGDAKWENMYLPSFEPDVSFTKSIRDRVASSKYGKLVPVIVHPEKEEEVVDGTLHLPKETEALRKKVCAHPYLHPHLHIYKCIYI